MPPEPQINLAEDEEEDVETNTEILQGKYAPHLIWRCGAELVEFALVCGHVFGSDCLEDEELCPVCEIPIRNIKIALQTIAEA